MSHGEPREVVEELWHNIYLRGPMIFDADGIVAGGKYSQPSTGLPFGKGFVIGPDLIVELPLFGHHPHRIIDKIYELLAEMPIGDIDGDGLVDVVDLLALLGAWGPCTDPGDCPADLNGDGTVDVIDLLVLLGNWS